MREDLIGEEVVLTGPRAQIFRLLTGATRAFLKAAEIDGYDAGKLDADLQGAAEGLGAEDGIEARLRVTEDGLEVRVGPESDPTAARTVACVR